MFIFLILFIVSIIFIKYLYYYFTLTVKSITIKDFYSVKINNQQIYNVIDDKNNSYIIEHNMFAGNDVDTIIKKIIQGNKYNVQCYGVNFDALKLSQKIINLEYQ